MSRTQWVILSFLLVILVGLCALVGGFGLLLLWRGPLGPSLGLPTSAGFPTTLSSSTPFSPEQGTGQPTGSPIPGITATATPQTVCNGPQVMYLLVIGTDSRAENYLYGLSDVMRLARLDFVNPSVMVMYFPRDLYVEIPGISQHGGITHGKLNQAYLYGNPGYGYYNGSGQGPGLLARTLAVNFGVQVDHYAAINMGTFVKMIDAVGGVDVNLPYAVDGRSAQAGYSSSLYFSAGLHHLDGRQALTLARLRPEGTFQRSDQQNFILEALSQKLVSPAVLPKLPDLASTFLSYVQTDLSPQQISQLTCLLSKVGTQNVQFLEWPESMFTGTRVQDPVLGYTFVWDVDFNLIRAYVQAFEQGAWPSSPSAVSTATPNP